VEFDVFTLFPEVFPAYLETSILQRAQQKKSLIVRVHNIRDFTTDKHHTTDDVPYGGGGGMVMKPEPVFEAVERVLGSPAHAAPCPIILMTPQGRVFDQAIAMELSEHPRIALICGRYEGVDERIRTHLATDEISIGDFVLRAASFQPDPDRAITRLLPGVLGDQAAPHLIPTPAACWNTHFRARRNFGAEVPDVLLSGDHARMSAGDEQALPERWSAAAICNEAFERRGSQVHFGQDEMRA
jgi:tRNA (guanine37-N1)-methyltransferase